jgi:hypothetical protein
MVGRIGSAIQKCKWIGMRNQIQFFRRIWIWNTIQENRIGQKPGYGQNCQFHFGCNVSRPGQNWQLQYVWNISCPKNVSLAWMGFVVVKILNFNMSGMCRGQNHKFQHVWNVWWSKLSVSACLECVVVKIISFSMSGMPCGQNCPF